MYGMNGWCKEIPGGDLISRAAAINEFDGAKVDEAYCTEYDIGYNDGIDFAVSRLSVLPSAQPDTGYSDGYADGYKQGLKDAQPERKRGKWIDYTDEGYVECPFCHSATNCDGNEDELHFCFSCGADMREDDHDHT